MATQTLEFSYPAGETITARLVVAGSDTEAAASQSCVEMPNRIDRYSVQFSGMAGDFQLIVDNGGIEGAGAFYTLTDINSTFYGWDEQKPATATGGNLYAADATEREAVFQSGQLFDKTELQVSGDGSYIMLQPYSGPFGGAQDGVDYNYRAYSTTGTADGGNLYAADNSVRDSLSENPGFVKGDELKCNDPVDRGTYIWLTNWTGPFGDATANVNYQFMKVDNDGASYYAADLAAADVITGSGVIPGDSILVADTGVYIWKTVYAGTVGDAQAGTDYDYQARIVLDGGSHYAANNAARDQFFTDGLVAGDLIYNADESAKGTYIMLLPYTGPFGSATPGTTYQFIASPTVPPTSAIQQAANSVAY